MLKGMKYEMELNAEEGVKWNDMKKKSDPGVMNQPSSCL